MSTGSQASRSGPIDSKRVCSTLKSRSLLPFLSSLSPPPPAPPLCHPASFHRHRSLAPPSPSRASPISLCPSFSLVPFIRPFVCIGRKRCNGWTRSGKSEIPFSSDIKLYPPSPLPLFSASSFRWARLRANTFCEQTSRHKWNRLVDLYYFQGSERITRKSEYIVVVALLSFPPFFFFFSFQTHSATIDVSTVAIINYGSTIIRGGEKRIRSE